MSWTKKDLKNIASKVKSITYPTEPKNKIIIPKSEEEGKIHIRSVLLEIFFENGIKFFDEYKFDDVRKFRFDWAIPSLMIAIEYEGIFSDKSGHTTISGYNKDCIKYNLAVQNGWRILRYTAINYFDVKNDLLNLIQKVI